MANITLTGNANWSTCNSGAAPGESDTIYLGAYALTLDVATCTCAAIIASNGTTATAGTIVLSLASTTINANLTAGTVLLLTVGASTSVTINGTVRGGSASGAHGCRLSTTTSVATITSVIGGSSQSAYGCTQSGGTLTVTNVTGGSALYAHGVTQSNPSAVAYITNVTGGSYLVTYGFYSSNGTSYIGNATGGSAVYANGVYIDQMTTYCTIEMAKGGSVAGACGVAVQSGNLTLNGIDTSGVGQPFGGGVTKIADGVRLKFKDSDGNAKLFYGDSEMPAVAAVKKNTSYGAGDFTGTFSGHSLVNKMSRYLGNFLTGQTIRFAFNTISGTGAPITLAGTPVVRVFKDGATAAITEGTLPTISVDARATGSHLVTITADAINYPAGSDYSVCLTAGTVDGISQAGVELATFSIKNRVVNTTEIGGTTQTAKDLGAVAPDNKPIVDASGNTRAVDSSGNAIATASSQSSLLNAVNAITTNTARSMPVIPAWFVRPSADSTTYQVMLYLYTLQGQLEDADGQAVTIHARTAGGISRDANLAATAMTRVSAGKYTVDYTVASAHAQEAVYFDFTWNVGTTAMADSGVAEVQDAESLATLAAIHERTQHLPDDPASEASIAAIPTNPLLADDVRLPTSAIAAKADLPTDYQQRGQAVTLPAGVATEETAAAALAATQAATNAANFTGAFPAGVLANTPRTGYVLAGSSGSNAPSAATSDTEVSATAFKGGTTRLCARVFLNGADIKQADVASIAYSIYQLDKADPDARTAVTGHAAVALNAADVLFDTLQTDAQAANYNFRHLPPIDAAAAFAVAGAIYSVEYTVTPTSGQRIIVRFRVQCL